MAPTGIGRGFAALQRQLAPSTNTTLGNKKDTDQMQDTPKHLKRLVREWAAIAHDRELSKALRGLQAEFGRWERGDITAAELNEQIHEFHQGSSREIWRSYATNRLEPAVAFAIATGILRKEELPAELLRHVAGLVEFYETDQTAQQDV